MIKFRILVSLFMLYALMFLSPSCSKDEKKEVIDEKTDSAVFSRSGFQRVVSLSPTIDFVFDYDENLYVASNRNQIHLYSKGHNTLLQNITDFLDEKKISCMDYDKVNKEVIIGTEQSGFIVYKNEDEMILYSQYNSDLARNSVTGIHIDKNNNKWILSNTTVSRIEDDSFTNYYFDSFPISDLHLSAITSDNNGDIWIGSSAGLFKFDGNNWVLHNTEDFFGTYWVHVTDIGSDSENNVWFIGPSFGLVKFDGNVFSKHTHTSDYDVSTTCFCLEIDGNDNIWYGSGGLGMNGGLIRYNGESWKYLKSESEVLDDAWNVEVMKIDSLGKIWFYSDDTRSICTFN